jgi:hypothetical protein
MTRRQISLLLGFLALFGLLGYFREYFFYYINSILYTKFYDRPTNIIHPAVMKPFESWDYSTLYYAKYPFTLAWTALFLAGSHFFLKLLSGNRLLIRILWISYAVMILLAGLSIGYSYLVHGKAEVDEYTLSRWLLGIAQSPLVCLILLAGEKLIRKETGSPRP